MDPAVADELHQRHARHLATHRVESGQHDRLGGVVDDEVDAGGLLERPDVAALTADDPALHLLVRAGSTTVMVASLVWSAAIRCMTVVRMRRARSSPSSWAWRSISRTRCWASACASSTIWPMSLSAGLRRGEARYALELDQLATSQVVEPGPFGLQLGLAGCRAPSHAARAPPSRRSMRLLPVEEAALGPLQGGALLARLLLGGTTQMQRLVLALEDDLLLLGACLGHETLAVLLGVLDSTVGHEGARHEADDDPDDDGDRRHDHDDEFRHVELPPSGARLGDVAPAPGASVRSIVTVDVRPGAECSASPHASGPAERSWLAAEDAAHQAHVIEISRHEVLEHDPLDPVRLERPDPLVGLVRGAHDPATPPLGEPLRRRRSPPGRARREGRPRGPGAPLATRR